MENGPLPVPEPGSPTTAPSPETAPPEWAASEIPPPLPPIEPAGPPPTPAPVRATFEFHGSAQEYFRIWIVNTLLTLLTLGVFAAWAKVRKRRYLRGNTRLLGHSFHYTAEPWRVLIGLVLVTLLFLAYSVFGAVYPWVRLGAVVMIGCLMPWIVIRSMMFNAYHTVYRGLRFRCRKNYAHAFGVYLALPVLCVVTLGLYYPAFERRRRQLTIDNHRYGEAFFRFDGKTGPFYGAYTLGALIFFGLVMLGQVVVTLLTLSGALKAGASLNFTVGFISGLIGMFLFRIIIFPRIFNHVWNHTHLDRHSFSASLRAGTWLKLQCVNIAAVILSAGLLYPWTVMRTVRYTLSCLTLQIDGSLDDIQAFGQTKSGGAAGDSAAEMFGLDFGL